MTAEPTESRVPIYSQRQIAPAIAWSWRPDAAPAAISLELAAQRIDVAKAWACGFTIDAPTAVRFLAVPPNVLSLPLAPAAMRTESFTFPAPSASPVFATNSPAGAVDSPSPIGSALRGAATRLKPPGDVVKLKDRLYYVLQPALETLVAAGSLDFPFMPFPYQFEGIAFLYPRVAALLADEMGLGKTMQAITAIRLLMHAGEIRSVLLVCPKPLVTNWQREFAQWAPELPLTVIEGDQEKRNWQWQLPAAPIKMANYELLNRDRRMLDDPNLSFDLVVLDESQRIKNRNGATSQVVRSIRPHAELGDHGHARRKQRR